MLGLVTALPVSVGETRPTLSMFAPGSCLRTWQTDLDVHDAGAGLCDSWIDSFAAKALTSPVQSNEPSITLDAGSGKPLIVYNGTTTLQTEDTVAGSLIGAFTAIVLLKATVASQFLFAAASAGNTTNFLQFSLGATGAISIVRGSGTPSTVTTTQTLSNGSKYVLTFLFDGSLATIRINGVATSVNATALAGGTPAFNTFVLGSKRTSSGYVTPFSSCSFGALGLWSAALASSDYTAIENYLMSNF